MSGPIPTATLPSVGPAPDGAHREPFPERFDLAALRDVMNLTNQKMLAARLSPGNPVELRDARRAHLLAMARYEHALVICGLPTPRRLHQEVKLLRRLLA